MLLSCFLMFVCLQAEEFDELLCESEELAHQRREAAEMLEVRSPLGLKTCPHDVSEMRKRVHG